MSSGRPSVRICLPCRLSQSLSIEFQKTSLRSEWPTRMTSWARLWRCTTATSCLANRKAQEESECVCLSLYIIYIIYILVCAWTCMRVTGGGSVSIPEAEWTRSCRPSGSGSDAFKGKQLSPKLPMSYCNTYNGRPGFCFCPYRHHERREKRGS